MSATLFSIRLPFHLELDHVYVHLLADGEGWILVDAGFGTAESFATLEAGLARMGVEWRQIHTLVLTHAHPDHMALAPQILDRSGARLLMHARELAFLERAPRFSGIDPNLEDWGTPRELNQQVGDALRATGRYLRPLQASAFLKDGDRVGAWEVLWTPGHARGHICLFHRESATLIAGDHVLPGITPFISWWEDEDSLTAFLASLDRVAALGAGRVIPSHGLPFDGLPSRVAEIRDHHENRCEVIRRGVAAGARTPHELVAVLWPRQLTPFQYRFAIYEIMAHLKYMELASPGLRMA